MAQRKAAVTVAVPLLALGVVVVLALQTGILGGLKTQVQDLAASGAMGGKGKPIQVETLERGMMGPYQGEAEVLISTPEEWTGTMDEYAAQGELLGVPSTPQVDWKNQAVVLVSMGRHNTMGWSVEVAGATRKGNKLILDVVKTQPSGGSRIQSMCAPYHLVCLNAPGVKELVIEERWETPGGGPTALSGEGTLGTDTTKTTSWGDIKKKYTNP